MAACKVTIRIPLILYFVLTVLVLDRGFGRSIWLQALGIKKTSHFMVRILTRESRSPLQCRERLEARGTREQPGGGR